MAEAVQTVLPVLVESNLSSQFRELACCDAAPTVHLKEALLAMQVPEHPRKIAAGSPDQCRHTLHIARNRDGRGEISGRDPALEHGEAGAQAPVGPGPGAQDGKSDHTGEREDSTDPQAPRTECSQYLHGSSCRQRRTTPPGISTPGLMQVVKLGFFKPLRLRAATPAAKTPLPTASRFAIHSSHDRTRGPDPAISSKNA